MARRRTTILSLLAVLAAPLFAGEARAGTTITVANGDAAGLVTAIADASSETGVSAGPDTIELAAGGRYTLFGINNLVDGTNGLPDVTSDITVNAHGATIERRSANGVPPFRFFHVASGGSL